MPGRFGRTLRRFAAETLDDLAGLDDLIAVVAV
jgi:hypothetical protein